jgi:hypothetical protein
MFITERIELCCSLLPELSDALIFTCHADVSAPVGVFDGDDGNDIFAVPTGLPDIPTYLMACGASLLTRGWNRNRYFIAYASYIPTLRKQLRTLANDPGSSSRTPL